LANAKIADGWMALPIAPKKIPKYIALEEGGKENVRRFESQDIPTSRQNETTPEEEFPKKQKKQERRASRGGVTTTQSKQRGTVGRQRSRMGSEKIYSANQAKKKAGPRRPMKQNCVNKVAWKASKKSPP